MSLKSDAQCKMKNGNGGFSLGDIKFAFLFRERVQISVGNPIMGNGPD